jgi:DNA-binding GntR family transcriptional regulator
MDMPDEIDRWGEDPLYVQLAAILRAQIESGELRPGDQLPSETVLTQRHGLARNTVRAAIKVLRDEGLVETRPQRGSRVVPDKH